MSPIQRKFNFTTFFVKVQLGQSLHNHTIFMFPIVNDLCMQKHGPTEGIRTLQDKKTLWYHSVNLSAFFFSFSFQIFELRSVEELTEEWLVEKLKFFR